MHCDYWGDSRIETNAVLKKRRLEKMSEPKYIHGTENTYKLINFK